MSDQQPPPYPDPNQPPRPPEFQKPQAAPPPYPPQYPQQPGVPMYAAPGANAPLVLPAGIVLASPGRRIGAYFLSALLFICTLGIGYLIWGALVWGKGTSPALQVLGMRAWKPTERRVGDWGTMATRNILDYLVQIISCGIAPIVSFILFLVDDNHRTIADRIGGTVIVHDPNKVLG